MKIATVLLALALFCASQPAKADDTWFINPANPASPLSPANPGNPASPLNPLNLHGSGSVTIPQWLAKSMVLILLAIIAISWGRLLILTFSMSDGLIFKIFQIGILVAVGWVFVFCVQLARVRGVF